MAEFSGLKTSADLYKHDSGEAGGTSFHTFSIEEKMAFSEHINLCMRDSSLVRRHLPLDVDSNDLFVKTSDGLILCKLINLTAMDTIDERALNTKPNLNVYQRTENLNLALNAAKSIGCQIVNIGSQDILEGRPILILGLLWQIIKIQLMSQISLKNFPELVLLLEEGEDLAKFMKLPPESILLRWVNYHLGKAGSAKKLTNFSTDVMDSDIYSILTNRLNKALCPLAKMTDHNERAAHVIRNAQALGAETFIRPRDITDGNKKLNISFVAQIFNANHGLTLGAEASPVILEPEPVDAEDTREARTFRMWMNSLNIENVYINDLFDDLHDGEKLLKIIDTVGGGCVDWKKVNHEPTSRFKKIENANYAVKLCKEVLKIHVVNVGGVDIVDGRKKMMLSLIWQMIHISIVKLLETLGRSQGITTITEEVIVGWANRKVHESGKGSAMRNFKDSTLKTGVFLLDLISAIEPRAVTPEVVTPGTDDESRLLNAKYAISCARKIGAAVFLGPEDIIEGKSKMLFTFCASLWTAELSR